MKLAATALTALLVATSAGAAFANTAAPESTTVLVPTDAVYAAGDDTGIVTSQVELTSGTNRDIPATRLPVSMQRSQSLASNDTVTVTSFPRADVPLLASSGR
ncbi:hypothetical protein KM176_10725 [Pseudooceanicola sp. CBS1P-1]|uniref:Uncharacterized protein n=1 Tax=Pseudooceanicola albus TaxID=2692189 RepID=A0A6L7G9G0_9RHOB|nr:MULTISPECIES: hypothetical protein [Pseudooceanicola]MBT9384332.1 hypothetical protein [Pseudooceanicola endophyticus]MXN19930.1 hypothetical protein [Pseudooceanicola albus]